MRITDICYLTPFNKFVPNENESSLLSTRTVHATRLIAWREEKGTGHSRCWYLSWRCSSILFIFDRIINSFSGQPCQLKVIIFNYIFVQIDRVWTSRHIHALPVSFPPGDSGFPQIPRFRRFPGSLSCPSVMNGFLILSKRWARLTYSKKLHMVVLQVNKMALPEPRQFHATRKILQRLFQ